MKFKLTYYPEGRFREAQCLNRSATRVAWKLATFINSCTLNYVNDKSMSISDVKRKPQSSPLQNSDELTCVLCLFTLIYRYRLELGTSSRWPNSSRIFLAYFLGLNISPRSIVSGHVGRDEKCDLDKNLKTETICLTFSPSRFGLAGGNSLSISGRRARIQFLV